MTKSLVPSEEQTTEAKVVEADVGALEAAQIGPEFVQTCPFGLYAVAASLLPSAEEATDNHGSEGAALEIHVNPEFVDV